MPSTAATSIRPPKPASVPGLPSASPAPTPASKSGFQQFLNYAVGVPAVAGARMRAGLARQPEFDDLAVGEDNITVLMVPCGISHVIPPRRDPEGIGKAP